MPPPKYNLPDVELKNSKAIYTEKETYKFQVINVYLFIVYYLLIFISIYFLLTAYDLQMYQSIPIVLFLLVMPFVMYSIESYVIDSSNYFSALLLGNTYEKKN